MHCSKMGLRRMAVTSICPAVTLLLRWGDHSILITLMTAKMPNMTINGGKCENGIE
jgi:hypothetical protein